MIKTFLILAVTILLMMNCSIAQKPDASQMAVPYNLADRDRGIRMEAEIVAINKRIDDMNHDFDKRFEQFDKRFEELRADTKEQFDSLKTAFGWVVTIFLALIIFLIGIVIRDRKILFPIQNQLHEIDLELKEIKKETSFGKVIPVFRELAKSNPQIAEVLKNNNLL